jgi:hypothetical protein
MALMLRAGAMKRAIAVLAAAVALVAGAGSIRAQPSQYLCIVEHAAGLHYDAQVGASQPQMFAAGRKYIMRRVTADDWNGHLGGTLRAEKPRPTWMFFEFDDAKTPVAVLG